MQGRKRRKYQYTAFDLVKRCYGIHHRYLSSVGLSDPAMYLSDKLYSQLPWNPTFFSSPSLNLPSLPSKLFLFHHIWIFRQQVSYMLNLMVQHTITDSSSTSRLGSDEEDELYEEVENTRRQHSQFTRFMHYVYHTADVDSSSSASHAFNTAMSWYKNGEHIPLYNFSLRHLLRNNTNGVMSQDARVYLSMALGIAVNAVSQTCFKKTMQNQ